MTDTITIELTEDQRDFLHCILYQIVGGDDDGPRRFGTEIMRKLTYCNVNRFDVTVEDVTGHGCSMCVVVRDAE